MSDSREPDLRPARPPRRRTKASAPGEDVGGQLERLDSLLRDGFGALESHLQGSAGGSGDRLEEVVELLEASIDHLVSIERRLTAIEAQLAPPPAAPPATRARRTRKQAQPDS